MSAGMNLTSDYRVSHAESGYGRHYAKTYEEGYYAEQWRELERPMLVDVLTRLRDSGLTTYLDFACGTGRILGVAGQIFDDPTGVDISEAMLEVAREAAGSAKLVHADITRDPIGGQYDVITAFRFFLNAEPGLAAEVLSELRRIISPEGRLVLNIHVNSTSPLGLAYRLRAAIPGKAKANTKSLAAMTKLLAENGFLVEQVQWYSYLPRTGWRLGWLSKNLLVPVERIATRLPGLTKTAQSFMLVCEPKVS